MKVNGARTQFAARRQAMLRQGIELDTSFEHRVAFDHDRRTLELDLSDVTLDSSTVVATLFDTVERLTKATGETWFLLVNYLNFRIYPEAWMAYAERSDQFREKYAMASVRYNASGGASGVDTFATRGAALVALDALLAKAPPRKTVHVIDPALAEQLRARIAFDPESHVLDLDFSDFTFDSAELVDDFFDVLEYATSKQPARKWLVVVNHRNCRTYPEAWVAYGRRSKRFTTAHAAAVTRFDETGALGADAPVSRAAAVALLNAVGP